MTLRETEADMREERSIADKLRAAWGVVLQKLPKNYHIDYAIKRGDETIGYVECRRRNMHSGKFKTIYLSLKKWLGLSQVNNESHKPTYFVVQLDDKLLYTRADGRELKHSVDGNRRDEPEPVVHIPIEEMKEVKNHATKALRRNGKKERGV